MQDTRLNRLTSNISTRFMTWLRNPWRRYSLMLIGLLGGFFLGNAISTTAGQTAKLDVSVAALLIVVTEGISRIVYATKTKTPSLTADIANALKIGITYSLFLDALKLGS
jgi:FtsH-binding integral membrane protein